MALLLMVGYSLLPLIPFIVSPEKSSTVYIDPDLITSSSDAGCPDDTSCSTACREDLRFKTGGSCVGPDKALCSCEPPLNATWPPVRDCDADECRRICYRIRIPSGGKCIDGKCYCGSRPEELQPAEAMDNTCQLRSCYDECYIGLFPPIFYWCKQGFCHCGIWW